MASRIIRFNSFKQLDILKCNIKPNILSSISSNNRPPQSNVGYPMLNDIATDLQSLALQASEKYSTDIIPKEIRLPSLIKPYVITVPTLESTKEVFDFPNIYEEKIDPASTNIISDPNQSKVVEKKAHTMLTIRRKKMKKQKKKKWLRKFGYLVAKKQFKKDQLEERQFQNVQIAQILEMESYSPEKYAQDLIKEAKADVPIPKRWEYFPLRGYKYHMKKRAERLEREKIEEKQQKRQEIIDRVASRNDPMR